MADNKDKKVLKTSIEREESQTRLNSPESEKIKGSTNLNVPHLRFPEFGGEWETYIIADILCIGNGRDYKQLSKGDIPVFGTGGYMTSVNECLYEGETTFIGRKGTINKPFYYNGKFWTVDTLFYTHSFKRVIPKFVYCLFQTINWLRYNEASGVPSLSKDTIEKIKVRIPQLDEQKKIAKLLSLLEERIATQNKIIEDLKLLKSAISKYLFARKDLLETTICLSNIATLKNGYAFQSSKYNALGKWKILTITNVTGERYINDEDCNCIINLPNDIQDHQVLKEGDILISLTGNVGRVSLCKNGNYLLNQRVGLLQLAKNVNQEFLYQILSSQRFENSMIACGQGAAQMNIGKGDVENYVLPYSSNGNNILWVAKILYSYDECIINELRRLTLLTMQKQYLLTQMFI